MIKNVLTIAASTAVLSSASFAGDYSTSLETSGVTSSFADYLTGGVKLYKNSSNAFIQEIGLFGRAQYQHGYTDGSADGGDFSGDGGELRRLRLGTKVKLFNKFELKANANLENGGFRNTSLRYNSLDEAKLTYKAGDVAGFEDVAVAFGRHKHTLSGESHHSSKSLKTVERSNIANFFYDSSRPTGLTFEGTKNGYELKVGIFSAHDSGRDITGDYDDLAYYVNVQKNGWNFDAFFNDNDGSDDEFDNIKWGTSLAYEAEVAGWDLFLNAIYGQSSDSDNDDVYGFVVMPTKYIIEDKLEAVFRYQYAGSSGDQIRPNSRNIRNVAERDGLVGSNQINRGDENHTIYAGLNYYFVGNNSKAQIGVEYETLDGDNEDLEATTLWAAYRMYF